MIGAPTCVTVLIMGCHVMHVNALHSVYNVLVISRSVMDVKTFGVTVVAHSVVVVHT